MTNIAVFASGAGTNAHEIIRHFNGHPTIRVALIVCNKPGAGVLQIAAAANIPVLMIEKERFLLGDAYIAELKTHDIEFIVLAGFLWKLPPRLISAYPQKIVNIHPALLPSHGGKGMYGQKVHAAVLAAGDAETGISIHFVDELYDHGAVIFQASCAVTADDTPASLAEKVHLLEHRHYPRVIEETVQLQNHR